MSLHKKIIQHSKNIYSSTKKKISDQKKAKKKPQDRSLKIPSLFFSQDETPPMLTHISLISALKIIGVVVGIFLLGSFLERTSEIFISLGLAFFLAAALFPAVAFLENKRFPRGVAIAIVFSAVLSTVIFILLTLFPALIEQFINLGQLIISTINKIYSGDYSPLPDFLVQYGANIQQALIDINNTFSGDDGKQIFQTLSENLSNFKDFGQNTIAWFFSAFWTTITWIINFILVVVISFFILFDREKMRAFFLSFFSPKVQTYVDTKGTKIQEKMAAWIHGQMILFLFMGGVTFAVLSFLEVPYALTLAFLTGLAEFVPYLGPFFAFCMAAPIAFGVSPEVGLAVVIFFLILQSIEGNFLVPMVMSKAIGVPPIVTILAMLVGFEYLGVPGAVMAVPLASIVGIFIFDIRKAEQKNFLKQDKKRKEKKKKQ